MAVFISLNGNSAGDGFLVAPLATTYDAELALWTDTGTASVTIQASPNAAGLVFSQTTATISTSPTIINVHATLQSATRGDTVIEVRQGTTLEASFDVTSISHPQVNFRGRFEARFGTDGGFYNRNPMYTAVLDNVVPPGWTWGLEGEPDFVPAVGNVPENLEVPVGREIRLNNPVALRSHAAPVVSTVDSISGDTATGTETFTAGDPLIGQPVDFGPSTYFAGNNPQNPSDPAPEEFFGPAVEPLALFEIHFGAFFSGASRVGPFVAKATTVNQITRSPDSRPIANGLVGAAAELAEFGLPDLQTFSETRINQLVTDYDALPAGPSPQRRNLARRIGHLLPRVSFATRSAIMTSHPGEFIQRAGTLTGGWGNKEVYEGKVDDSLVFSPSGSPVVEYMSQFNSFNIEWNPFAFHSDELCGHHIGSLTHLNSDGTYSGDPHTRTVDGTRYDFQAVGEFTLLKEGKKMEVQVRQTPVPTQNPITDSYTGLTSCVSVITAVAASLGKHRIALQPEPEKSELQLYLDGKPVEFPVGGMQLDGHLITAFNANGETGIRVDYANETVLLITPHFWNNHNVWYINVSIQNTRGVEGIMGYVPKDSWLPRLREGVNLGPMPSDMNDRYEVLYRKFADSWRVTDNTSLFVYQKGTSTKTFTDREWPAFEPPCKLKPGFENPGVPVHAGMSLAQARMICRGVTEKDLHRNCVFDVATTGDEIFARGYLFAQELRLYGTKVSLKLDEAAEFGRIPIEPGEEQPAPSVRPAKVVTAKVSPLASGRPAPTGCLTFLVDGMPSHRAQELDQRGRATIKLTHLKPGRHTIKAIYAGGGKYNYHGSVSPELVITIEEKPKEEPEEVKQDDDCKAE